MEWLKNVMEWLKDNYAAVVIFICLLLIFASSVTGNLFSDGPDDWLIEWTAWVSSYVALAVAAYAIVKLANGAEKVLNRWIENNPLPSKDKHEQGSTSK